MVTQPLMYKAIHRHPTTRKIYSEKLAAEGVIPADGGDAMVQNFRTALDGGHHTNQTILSNYKPPFEVDWKPYLGTKWNENDDTRLPLEHLQMLGRKIAEVQANFKLHPRVDKIMADRKLMAEGKLPLDWGMAENLAYASLLRGWYLMRFRRHVYVAVILSLGNLYYILREHDITLLLNLSLLFLRLLTRRAFIFVRFPHVGVNM